MTTAMQDVWQEAVYDQEMIDQANNFFKSDDSSKFKLNTIEDLSDIAKFDLVL